MRKPMRNADGGSRKRFPKPPTPSPQPPSGISLIEILISMGILALGLLGVAALFPVGGHYLRQGDVSDRADAIAQAAFSDAAARGLLDPERWLSNSVYPSPVSAVFEVPFADRLRSTLAKSASNGDDLATVNQTLNRTLGSVYIVDPLGVANTMDPMLVRQIRGRTGPSIPFVPAASSASGFAASHAAWQPWAVNSSPDTGAWPIRRLTVTSGAVPIPGQPLAMRAPQAEAIVLADDDLSIQLDDYSGNPYQANPDNPSQQLWSAAGPSRLSRLTQGNFSWFVSVVPTTPEARIGLATDAESFYYDISLVVFYKRAFGDVFDFTTPPFNGHQPALLAERQVRAVIGTPGVGGGQLRVVADAGEFQPARNAESPLEKLRGGQWVMLFGPHPDSTPTRPLLFCQWYKVVSVEKDPAADASVFVRGPDWPWKPTGSLAPGDGIQNDLRLVIMPDVVAVHTRTMKLNAGSAWGIE